MRSLRTFIRIVRSVKSRPNRYFALLIITIIALFMLAYMHDYNIVYMVMFFTFAFATASSWIGRRNLDVLAVRYLSHARFFAGSTSLCRLVIEDHSAHISYAVDCTYGSQRRRIQRIAPFSSEIVTFDIGSDRRGLWVLPDLEIASHFPLAYERFYTTRKVGKEVVVYPKAEGVALQEYLLHDLAHIGERDDFEGLRTHQEGDAITTIHWPSLASGSQLMSMQFTHIRQMRTLRFDFLSCADDDEARLSQLCLWVLSCEHEGLAYTIAMPDRLLESKKMTTDEILTILATF